MDGAGEFEPWAAVGEREAVSTLLERALEEETAAAARLAPEARRARMRWYRRARQLAAHLDAAGIDVPAEHLTRYAAPPVRRTRLPGKYQMRCLNNLREHARFAALFPELMGAGEPRRFRDLSAGPCANHEVIAHYGHVVELSDFFGARRRMRGAAYRNIHADIGCEVMHFDGSQLPYAAPGAPYDHVLCYQAIDAYAPSEGWAERIDAMLGMATRSVALIFNPPAPGEGLSRDAATTDALVDLVLEEIETPVQIRKTHCPDTGLPAAVIARAR